MKLLVVSHTPHYINENGRISGWGPTVREINFFLMLFDQVVHIAPLCEGPAPRSALTYLPGIEFVALRPAGGLGLIRKISVLVDMPGTLVKVIKCLRKADYFQFRAPTGMGVYMIPWLSLFGMTRGWFKYAGDWSVPSNSFSYRVQKRMLERWFKRYPVTINGIWKDQPPHVLSFENPALTEEDIIEGQKLVPSKDYNLKLRLLYVGRIESDKGIQVALETVTFLGPGFEEFVLIGEGSISRFDLQARATPIPVRFLGGLDRPSLNRWYGQSHILLFPSLSEGFPKVVAEAMAFGCVPAVSNVSAVGQYVNDSNGLVFTSSNPREMAHQLNDMAADRSSLRERAFAGAKTAARFTYSHYLDRIRDEILKP